MATSVPRRGTGPDDRFAQITEVRGLEGPAAPRLALDG